MKQSVVLILFAFLTLNGIAQQAKIYEGVINKTIKITMYLQGLDEGTNADPIVGAYKYNNKKSYLLLYCFHLSLLMPNATSLLNLGVLIL